MYTEYLSDSFRLYTLIWMKTTHHINRTHSTRYYSQKIKTFCFYNITKIMRYSSSLE